MGQIYEGDVGRHGIYLLLKLRRRLYTGVECQNSLRLLEKSSLSRQDADFGRSGSAVHQRSRRGKQPPLSSHVFTRERITVSIFCCTGIRPLQPVSAIGPLSGVSATRRSPRARIPCTIAGSAASVAERSPPPSCMSTIEPGRTAERPRCAICCAVVRGTQSVGST